MTEATFHIPEERGDEPGGLVQGVAVLQSALRTLPLTPGVYRMLNSADQVLYVGKAKNLKRRVSSYIQLNRLSNRIRRMVAETKQLEVTLTHTEAEALLLEGNLIKELLPRYNILMRDDKSFPSIIIRRDHPFPQVQKHRGAQTLKGDYFGPFASAQAVNQSLEVLQRAFLLRPCSDSVFASRSRPCLQYQIKRCSAPCVGRISEAEYGELVAEAKAFLLGKNTGLQTKLAKSMHAAAEAMEFEKAANFRDRIRALTQVQARQTVNLPNVKEADIFALHQAGGQCAIQVFFHRNGRNYGGNVYFPSHTEGEDAASILAAFLPQFYSGRTPPKEILLSDLPSNARLLEEALGQLAKKRIRLSAPKRHEKGKAVEHALTNAREALARRMSEQNLQGQLLDELAGRFALDGPLRRIEVYDNSHISGRHPYGVMIVAGREGFLKSAYRKFSIKGGLTAKADMVPFDEIGDQDLAPVAGGDDYAMMREVLRRRFARGGKSADNIGAGWSWPDLVLIDGGKGQLRIAEEVLRECGLESIPVMAIAKGPERNAGQERFFVPGRDTPIRLEPRDPVLYFLQRLRDEAHRFAIGAHRKGRSRQISQSPLDGISGIGAKRKKALLTHFGSAREVARAGLGDLEAVPGINKQVAKKIYAYFHDGG